MDRQMMQKKHKRIEAGVRFGWLTCREITSEGGFGGSVWRCLCKCGTAIEVSEAMLFSGVVRSCGCQIRVAAREAKTYIDGTCLEIMLS